LPDEPPAGHLIRTLHLNADYVDPTLMRSALSYTLFDRVGALAPRFRHLDVTVSGEPVGVYVGMESVDRDWCRRRGLPPGPIYYAINRNANFGLISPFSKELKQPLDNGYHPLYGVDTAPLQQMILAINMADSYSFPSVAQRWIDLDGYLRWLMTAVFVGNRDGFVHNYALYFNSDAQQFQIIPWDYDATWGVDIHGNPARLDRVPLLGWNKLSRRLMSVPAVRRQYRRMFQEALDGPFSPSEVGALVDEMSESIAPEVLADRCRKGRPEDWEADVGALKRWAADRGALLYDDLTAL
jgi:spore coat protein H